jgi:hypothetical protein
VAIGELIRIPRIPFFFGDLIEEIREAVRECDFVGALRLLGLIFSRRLLEVVLCPRDEADGSGIGAGMSAILRPAALAASCSITCAYRSSSPCCRTSRSASTMRESTAGLFPGETGEQF